jgi:toxin CcdB
MARFDVYKNLGRGRRFPLLADVQAPFLANLETRLVVPLSPLVAEASLRPRLHVVAEVEGVRHVLLTELLGSVDRRSLGPVVTSLAHRHDEIVGAIDFLLQGF